MLEPAICIYRGSQTALSSLPLRSQLKVFRVASHWNGVITICSLLAGFLWNSCRTYFATSSQPTQNFLLIFRASLLYSPTGELRVSLILGSGLALPLMFGKNTRDRRDVVSSTSLIRQPVSPTHLDLSRDALLSVVITVHDYSSPPMEQNLHMAVGMLYAHSWQFRSLEIYFRLDSSDVVLPLPRSLSNLERLSFLHNVTL